MLAPLVLLLLACDDPVGDQATMLATLVSPNGAEGAALVELPVDGVSGVTAVDGEVLELIQGGRRQIAIVRDAPGPISFRFTFADETRPPEVRVVQVSGPDDTPRALAGYRVDVTVPPPAAP